MQEGNAGAHACQAVDPSWDLLTAEDLKQSISISELIRYLTKEILIHTELFLAQGRFFLQKLMFHEGFGWYIMS